MLPMTHGSEFLHLVLDARLQILCLLNSNMLGAPFSLKPFIHVFFKNLWSLGVVRSFAQVETVTTRLAQQVILEDQESLKEVRAWNGNDGLILALASTG